MKAIKYKWRRLAFKSIYSVIGIVLFTAQVSYKFYRSASMPAFQTVAEAGAYSGQKTFSAKSHTSSPTLDKRFDLQHTFALLTPFFELTQFKQPSLLLTGFFEYKTTSLPRTPSQPRGPPSLIC